MNTLGYIENNTNADRKSRRTLRNAFLSVADRRGGVEANIRM